jgi:hypothetical protein
MPDARYKLTLVAVTVAACVGLLAWLGPRSGRRAPLPEVDPASLAGNRLDEATARQLLQHLQANPSVVYDPVAIVRPAPNLCKTYTWPERPDGTLTIVTNGQGLREDEEVAPVKAGVRVLVVGDSHTFGLVDNSETFANRLEDALDPLPDGTRCEVVNAGVGGTGPYEELGSIEEFLSLDPDLVLVVFFDGNDFLNCVRFARFFSKQSTPPFSDEQTARQEAARERGGSRLAEGFRQAYDFALRPENAQIGLEAAIERCRAMAGLCAAHDVGFLLAVLPSKVEVDGADDRELSDALLDDLGLTQQQFDLNRRLAVRLIERLRADGLTVVDLYEPLRAEPRPLYWRRDHHLATAGHALVAELLEAPVRAALAAQR